jgi:hypothetical protein
MEIHLLPWAAQMNVHADSLATDFLDNCAEPAKLVPFIPASQASLTIHGETITRRCASGLCQAANSPRICQHLMARNDWTYATLRSINWEAPGKAMNTLENSVKTFIVKFAHDLLPTRRHMHPIKKSATATYPSCLHITETSWHILSCPSRSVWRTELLRSLGELLVTNHTQLDLALILLQGIRGALSNQHFQMNPNNREPIFRALVNSQNKIGWQHILKGRFSKQWTQIQGRHILD